MLQFQLLGSCISCRFDASWTLDRTGIPKSKLCDLVDVVPHPVPNVATDRADALDVPTSAEKSSLNSLKLKNKKLATFSEECV